jgi:STE24 endopeptidase
MSETTAARMVKGGKLAVAVALWLVCAYFLSRTIVPSLHLSGLDEHRFFSASELRRAAHFSRGEQGLFVLATLAKLGALAVLVWRLPPTVRAIGLGRIATAVVVAMVALTTLWFTALPFGLADLWWQHHWGLGPFGVTDWLSTQWGTLADEAISALAGIVLVVGLAGRYRRWWLPATAVIAAVTAFFAFVSGWASSSGGHPLRDPQLRADVAHLERVEHVRGTPVTVQTVSSFTSQANAFTVGFGPSTHVVLWDTLLDGRFSRAEIDVVIAHELGHVASRHIVKAIGWSALVALPVFYLLELATRRRGGIADPVNVPFALLVLFVIVLVFTPIENAISRRDEAEADWHALNAARDPSAQAALFEQFARTSLEEPDPPLLDYLWLENHPTLMQRIAMARAWRVSCGRPSRAGPGCP